MSLLKRIFGREKERPKIDTSISQPLLRAGKKKSHIWYLDEEDVAKELTSQEPHFNPHNEEVLKEKIKKKLERQSWKDISFFIYNLKPIADNLDEETKKGYLDFMTEQRFATLNENGELQEPANIRLIKKNLDWILKLEDSGQTYTKERYDEWVEKFDREINYTPFFEELKRRLDKLSDEAGKWISKSCGFYQIEYLFDDYSGGVVGEYQPIKYVRKFTQEEKERLHMSKYREVKVEKGYTGFRFTNLAGLSLGESQKEIKHYMPDLEIIPVTPEQINQVLNRQRKQRKIHPFYEPTVNDFIYNWLYAGTTDTCHIEPEKVWPTKEREYIIKYRGIDPKVAQEIEDKFPEAKKRMNDLIQEIKNWKPGDYLIH